jgi:hypothetical protein
MGIYFYTVQYMYYNILLYSIVPISLLFYVLLQFISYRCKDFCKLFYNLLFPL